MRLVYCVITCDGLGGSIACAWNHESWIVRWLPAYPEFVQYRQYHENVKLSTRDREEYTGHEKLQVFTVAANPDRNRRNLRRLPDFRFAPISPLLWSFSRFWSSFIAIEVSNEEEYSILRILYCYSLQQHIFLAFCNDFDTHYRMLSYILLRNKTLLFPKWRQNSSHSPLFLGHEHGNVQNCKNS